MIATLRARVDSLFSDRGFAEILRGSIYAVGARVGAVGLGLVSSVIVVRLYGAGTMGILAMIESLLMLAGVLALLGTGTSILRVIPEHVAKYSVTSAFRVYRKTQYLVVAVSLVVGGALFLTSDLVASRIFGKPNVSFAFSLAAAFVIAKTLMQLNTQAVRGLRLIRTFALMQMLPVASMLVLLLVGMALFDDPNVPIYARLGSFAVAALVGMCVMERTFRGRSRPADTVHTMPVRAITSMSLPMLLSGSMQFLIAQAGILILGVFGTEAEVGYYAVAVRLAGLTVFVLAAINSMAAPKFSELFHSGQTDEVLRVARKSTQLIFWTTTPILLGLILLGKPVLWLLFGGEFTVAYGAMVFLVVGQFINSISGSTAVFLNMTGHQGELQKIMMASAAVNVALNFALIPRFGIEGAAVAAMVTAILWNSCALIYIKARFGKTIGYCPLLRAS